MIEDLMSAYGGRLVIAIVGVGIGLVCLIGILWILRGRSGPSPFVRGGRNRQPRLQVLDAAAVDARRRLVLVRRDDVEHLIMIGGPTDIVVESGIVGKTVQAPAEAAVTEPAAGVSERGAKQMPRSISVAAEAPVEPVREMPREAPIRNTGRVAPTPPAAPGTPLAQPEPVASVRPAQPAPQLRADQARTEVPLRQPVFEAKIPSAPLTPPPVPMSATTPAADDAASALEAARGRVLQERVEPPRIVAANSAAVPGTLQPAVDRPKVLGSDFERILEEEMATNLAAREAVVISQPNRQAPGRDPAVPPITGATPEPSLQDEVARIFGEMSATRDK
jgi:hypothetical protein